MMRISSSGATKVVPNPIPTTATLIFRLSLSSFPHSLQFRQNSPHPMMSATPDQQQPPPPPPPPQPPLPLSDPAFSLPEIVDGIDPEDAKTPPHPLSRESVSDVFSNLSERVSRVVRVSRTGVARAVESVVPPPPVKPPAVFLFGDSPTEYSVYVSHPTVSPGWSALLREAFGNRAEVFVRGFSGYNTRWALHMLPNLATSIAHLSALKAVVIFFGANDAALPGNAQHVPIEEYKQNLAKMVSFVNNLTGAPLPILITPPALSKQRQLTDERRRPQTTADYADACVDTGRRLGVPVVDLHAAMVGRAEGDDGVSHFLCDGLHLSTSGNRLVYELLTEIFRECVPEVSPDDLQSLYPHWEEIDSADPSAALGTSSLV